MPATQYHLLKTQRFAPLFITQFFNAFNDNVFKNALIILITYKIAQSASFAQLMIAITSGIFILPFFLFSATAGQIADKIEKAFLIKIIKFFEIIFMAIASIGFYLNSLPFLLTTLFLIGTHSTFFGPLKYSILPDHLRRDELIAGNALIEAGTFVAILVGSILGGLLIITRNGAHYMTLSLMTVAVLGWVSSLFIPATKSEQPNLRVRFNIFKETWKIIQLTRKQPDIFLAILGISWFWFVGTTFITQFPSFTKEVLHANAPVVTLFFTLFSLGIAIGSLLCNKLLKGQISAKYVPLSVFGMSIFIFDIYLATAVLKNSQPGALTSFIGFFKSITNIRIALDVFLLSLCGGIYIVPLYALIQARADEKVRSRIIACNNIINALFMVLSSIVMMVVFAFHFTIPQLFLIVAVFNVAVAIYICKLLPDAVVQSFFKWLLKLFYRVSVHGFEHYESAGDKVVIVANHTSFLDAVLLAAFLPKKLTFAVNTQIAQKTWLKLIAKIIRTFPLDPTNPLAIKSLIKQVRENQHCVIFPEGRITVTGSLMKIYEGPGLIADAADAIILPIRIDGAQYTPFSYLRNKVRIRWFPKITLTILPPTKFDLSKELVGRARRQLLGKSLYTIMSNMMFESSQFRKPLFTALLDAKKIHSGQHLILEDIQRKPLSYSNLIQAIFVVATLLKKKLQSTKTVGILLPNISGNVIYFFALHLLQRIPAMLNYSQGLHNLLSACETAGILDVITSKQFIKVAKLENVITALQQKKINVHYIEDLRTQLSFLTKITGFIKSIFPNYFYKEVLSSTTAVVLFTSGSEGTPKGVALSHNNIQANRFQLGARIDFTSQDIVFNALPMFHSFGLSAGTLLPILSGIKTFLYPSPLHYRIIPEMIYEINATITFGTDTFLRGYARFANPYDFYSIRYVLAGAERLKDETRDIWVKKFGIRILEGYGTTETAPVLSINTPMQYKPNTVGQFLPGIDYRLEPVPGIDKGGRLHVKGPNIMLGYLTHTPQKFNAPPEGWYDTGDIVVLDEEGFIKIQGRAKRFAKIGGEMVSLTAVEYYLADLWPASEHGVIAVPEQQKGEQMVLITTCVEAKRDAIMLFAKAKGIAEIQVPKKIIIVEKMPLLGTGKIDYSALQLLIRSE